MITSTANFAHARTFLVADYLESKVLLRRALMGGTKLWDGGVMIGNKMVTEHFESFQ